MKFNAAGDKLDPEPWVTRFFTEDATFVGAGGKEIKGRSAIIAMLKGHFTVIGSIRHTIKNIDVLPNRVYQEADVVWTVKGDTEATEVHGRGLGVFCKDVDSEQLSR